MQYFYSWITTLPIWIEHIGRNWNPNPKTLSKILKTVTKNRYQNKSWKCRNPKTRNRFIEQKNQNGNEKYKGSGFNFVYCILPSHPHFASASECERILHNTSWMDGNACTWKIIISSHYLFCMIHEGGRCSIKLKSRNEYEIERYT